MNRIKDCKNVKSIVPRKQCKRNIIMEIELTTEIIIPITENPLNACI